MNRKHLRRLLGALVGLWSAGLLSGGCYYDVEDELYGAPAPCDTTLAVSYLADVAPLVDRHCLGCHSAAAALGGVVLEGHSATRSSAVSGRLLCSLAHEAGCSPMPKNGDRLPDCDIALIRRWVAAGAPDN